MAALQPSKSDENAEKDRKQKIQQEIIKFLLNEMENLKKQPTITEVSHSTGCGTAAVTMVECTNRRVTDFVSANDVINERFRVIGKLREGGYGQIYKAYDSITDAEIALKLEVLEPGKRNQEAIVLTKFHASQHCPKIFAKGYVRRYVSYVAMQLLGKNLNELRKMCTFDPKRYSIGTAVRLIIQCLRGLEGLHEIGYIHRDVKPSNYAMGGHEDDQHIVYLLDYGLSRYYLNEQNAVKAPRSKSGFRGTVRYASLNAHEAKDLSRMDDLWSLFYSCYEFIIGKLPWKSPDKNVVALAKKENTPIKMCENLPVGITEFVKLIERLDYADKPLYNDMDKCLKSICDQVKMDDPFDWQLENGCNKLEHWSVN